MRSLFSQLPPPAAEAPPADWPCDGALNDPTPNLPLPVENAFFSAPTALDQQTNLPKRLPRAMPTLTVRDVPPALREKLKRRAERHRRSLNGEVLTVLEEGVRSAAPEEEEDRRALIERIRKEREDGPTITAGPDELNRMMREGLA